MRHEKARFAIDAYGPGELPQGLALDLEAHLRGCAECGAYQAQALQFQSFMASHPVEPRPERLELALRSVRRQTLRNLDAPPAGIRAFVASLLSTRPGLATATASAALVAVMAVALVSFEQERGGAAWSETESSGPVAHAMAAPSGDFRMVRAGEDIRIEWERNGRPHRVRTGQDPETLKIAGGDVVKGKVWTEPAAPQAPGTVTFYLVD